MYLSNPVASLSVTRVFRPCIALLALALMLPVAAVAQAPAATQAPAVATAGAAGVVHGTISDPDAAIIPGAALMFTPVKGNGISAKSGSDGSYRVSLPAGTYTVTVSMPGFATYNHQALKVNGGQSLTLDAKLIVGDETTIVNVTSDAASVSVDPDNAASTTVIKGDDLKALSDDPDELSAELTALAGPAAGPNGGQIYVDGFTGGQLPPKSSIREIRINQNPFSAEYDKLGFGRVEVFTKPGTDKYHGSMSVQGNDSALNTSNPFLGSTNSQPPYYTFFLLGNITGPLSKSSSFSLGGSRRTIQQNVIVDPTGFYSTSATATTPCAPGTITGCANYGYPATARAVFQPQLRQDITPRLDFALGPKNVLTIRYQYEGGNTQNAGTGGNSLPSTFTNTSSNENTVQISDTQTVSSKLVNETRFEYQRASSKANALSSAPLVSVQGSFASGGSNTQIANSVSTHIEVQNYTSLALAKNFIRFGGRLRTTGETATNTYNTGGSFTYNYLLDPCTDSTVTNKPSGCATTATPCVTGSAYISSYQCGTASQFSLITTQKPSISARETDVGLYAEDDWKAKPNLTISYGLRFETENKVSNHDLAPRLSIAYGIPRSGGKASTTVLRGGFGIFYDRFALGDFLTFNQLQPGVQTQTTVVNPGLACQPGAIANCGTSSPTRTTVYSLAPNLRSSYIMQSAFGLDQSIGHIGTVSINYLNARGNHEFLTRVTNNGTVVQRDFESTGVLRQNQIFINTNIRTKTVTMFGFYALNIANSNTSGSGFNPTSTDSRVDYGRATFAQRNTAVAGASYNAPFHITLSPFLLAHSGSPYNITTGTDLNGDTLYNDRPGFVSGVTPNCQNAATFNTSNAGGQIPINYCTGPAAVTLNLRASRTFGFGPRTDAAAGGGGNGGGRRNGGGGMPPMGGGPGGGGGGGRGGPGGGQGLGANSGRRYSVTIGAQAQNLFNDVNYAAPTATSALTSTQFGRQTQLLGRPFGQPNAVRLIQLQAAFNF